MANNISRYVVTKKNTQAPLGYSKRFVDPSPNEDSAIPNYFTKVGEWYRVKDHKLFVDSIFNGNVAPNHLSDYGEEIVQVQGEGFFLRNIWGD